MRVFPRSIAAICIASVFSPAANAEIYPVAGKPIRIVVPTAPSGGNDFMAQVISQKLTGRFKLSAIVGKMRSALFPALPALAESGVAGFEVVQWYGLFAPAKTPREIVDKLNTEIVAALKDPAVAGRFAEQGAEIVTGTPEEFGRFVVAEQLRWKKFVEVTQLKVD